MSQHPRSGGPLVGAWRSSQADQGFQALEAEFDAPAQAIEREDIGGGGGLWGQRCDDDHPIGGVQRSLRDGGTLPPSLPAHFAPPPPRRPRRLPVRNPSEGKSG